MSMQVSEPPMAPLRQIFDPLTRLFAAAVFLIGVTANLELAMDLSANGTVLLTVAAVVGGYMAMNIGANDVANNVGPTVGAGALTMGAADDRVRKENAAVRGVASCTFQLVRDAMIPVMFLNTPNALDE